MRFPVFCSLDLLSKSVSLSFLVGALLRIGETLWKVRLEAIKLSLTSYLEDDRWL